MASFKLPADLHAALNDILGETRLTVLLGSTGDNLTTAMEAAAIRCFREKRPEDEHTAMLRRAFAASDRGVL